MATENRILDISLIAGQSLVNDQYRFVMLDPSTGNVIRPTSETEYLLGILQNAPAAGEAAVVRIEGISKLEANGALSVDRLVCADYVDETTSGRGKDAGSNWEYARGHVLQSAGAAGDLAEVKLVGPFPKLNGNRVQQITVTTITTAGNVTLTAAQLLGGLILRNTNGGNRTDTTPTATQLIAAMKLGAVGNAFEFTIRNTASASETITLSGGTGVTISGTATIGQSNSKRFLAVIDSSSAVTIYSLGTSVH